MRRAALLALAVAVLSPAGAAAGDDGGLAKRASVFVPVEVLDVAQLDEGWAVLLMSRADEVVMPIFIGPAEGMAIQLRLNKQRAPRPMTHDLLESVIDALGAKVVRIDVDDLKDGVFLGRITLQQGAKTLQLDARPSDSIALALGKGAPIHVARTVLKRAGMTKESLERRRDARPEPPPKTESL